MSVTKSFYIKLDVKRATSNREFEVVNGDNGNRICIELTDNGMPVNMEDCRVMAVFSKPDGHTAQQDSEGHGLEISGEHNNILEIELYLTSMSPGLVECEIQVYSGDEQDMLITSARFNFACRRAILNQNTLVKTDEWPILIDLIRQVEQNEDIRNNNEEVRREYETERDIAEQDRQAGEQTRLDNEDIRIANETQRVENEVGRIGRDTAFSLWEEYDSLKTYVPLNKVSYQGSSYICMEEATGVSPANASHWQLIAQKGVDGTSFVVLGVYSTLAELEAAIPNPSYGDAYGVGVDNPDIYVYADTDEWKNFGSILGPQGEVGPPGPNMLNENTNTPLTGLLKGTGSHVSIAEAGVDYPKPAISVVIILDENDWLDGVITIFDQNITAVCAGSLRIAQTATAAEFEAWSVARPHVTAQGAGFITVTARGGIPAVAIPVELEVRT